MKGEAASGKKQINQARKDPNRKFKNSLSLNDELILCVLTVIVVNLQFFIALGPLANKSISFLV